MKTAVKTPNRVEKFKQESPALAIELGFFKSDDKSSLDMLFEYLFETDKDKLISIKNRYAAMYLDYKGVKLNNLERGMAKNFKFLYTQLTEFIKADPYFKGKSIY